MLKNVKIAVRMGLGFGLVIVLMITIILVSLNEMGDSRVKLDLIVRTNNVRLHHANNMIEDVREVSITIRNLLLVKDIKNTDAIKNKIAEGRKKYDESFKIVEDLTPKDDKNAWDIISSIKTHQDASRLLNNKVIDLTMGGKYDDANNLMFQEASPSAFQWTEQVGRLINYNEERNKLRYEQIQNEQNTSRTTMFIIGTIAVALPVLIVIFMTLGITGPLRQGVQMMQEMAQGHLGMRLKMGRRDEIGILADAMDQFSDDLQNVVVGAMKKIGDGDLSMEVVPKDGKDEISPALKATIDSLRGLVGEATMLTKAAVEGKLSTRGNTDAFKGAYQGIVQGVNDTLDAVIGPLNVAAGYVDRIAKGDIPQPITDSYNGDFNAIKNNLNQCIAAVNALIADANILSKAGVEGRLSTRADTSRHQGDFRKIVQGVNDTLDAMMGSVRETASNLTTATSEILAVTTEQASMSSEQSAAVSETTSTLQEVRQTAEQAAERARQVVDIAQESTRISDEGIVSLQNTLDGMSKIKEQVGTIAETILSLSEQTQQIGEIIATVNDIADQSNLLALNAAIEAARAGEAGKGFAVVAGEVRGLAEQSRQATAQVKDILGEIQKAANTAVMVTEEGTKRAESGVLLAQTTGEAIRSIRERIQQVAQSAQQVSVSTKQQLAGMDQIVTAMASINQAATQTDIGTKQTEKAAHNLNALASELSRKMEQYK